MDDNIVFLTYNQDRKIFFIWKYLLTRIKEIGDIIRHRRLELNISQMELGFRSELSKNCISEIELGNKNFKISSLLKILKALDFDFDAFSARNNKR